MAEAGPCWSGKDTEGEGTSPCEAAGFLGRSVASQLCGFVPKADRLCQLPLFLSIVPRVSLGGSAMHLHLETQKTHCYGV